MDQLELVVFLLALIVAVSVAVKKTIVPPPLALVLVGIAMGFIPGVPHLDLTPRAVLFGFMPPLIYQTAIAGHWSDLRRNKRTVALLSVGHVVFATLVIAVATHTWLNFGWPVAFMIGAILSPPDSIAIVSVAKKLPIPRRVVTILSGEGLFNDATALTILKFATIASLTHQFSLLSSVTTFLGIVVGETLYGLLLGYLAAMIRHRIAEAEVEILFSLVLPYVAFLPCEMVGGSGVVATAVLGFYMGFVRSKNFSSETRILGTSVWRTLVLAVEGLLFLWAGLNASSLLGLVGNYSIVYLGRAVAVVVGAATLARFAWMYPAAYLPQIISKRIRLADPLPSWRTPLLLSWCGMRGAISIAAALTIPIGGAVGPEQKQLVAFLTFSLVIFSLGVQGLSLPLVLRWLGFNQIHLLERTHSREQTSEALLKLRTSAESAGSSSEAIRLERQALAELLRAEQISSEVYLNIEQGLDFEEVSIVRNFSEPEA